MNRSIYRCFIALLLLVVGTFGQSAANRSISKCDLDGDVEHTQLLLGIKVGEGDEDCVRNLLKLGIDPNVSYEGDHRATPIFHAVANDQPKMIDILFENGVDRKSESVKLAFFYSCDTGKVNLAERFLVAGVPADSRDKDGVTALIHVALLGDLNMLKLLIKYGADPNATTPLGFAPLMAVNDDQSQIRLLLDSGAKVNATNKIGQTAIFSAISKLHKTKLEMLLKNGADPNVKDRKGRSPVDFARQLPDSEIKRELIDLLWYYGAK